MKVDEIEIHDGEPDREYESLQVVHARVGAATIFNKSPTLEDVNNKLREEALKLGANGVIRVRYKRGMSPVSWKAVRAWGLAVRLDSDEKTCPVCAETIKRAAVRCRFCGADVADAA